MAYFAELKRRIENRWTDPQEALRRGQSGTGQLPFLLRTDGSVRNVDIVRSSGIAVLDRHIEQAIRLSEPFPPIPPSLAQGLLEDGVLPVSLNFSYVLGSAPRPPSP